MCYLLHTHLLQVERETRLPQPTQLPPRYRDTFSRFSRAVEASFKRTRLVEDYAQGLNFSAKTLNRACLAVMGNSAKQFIDARVVLEAERLLAHTDLQVTEVASMLGFREPTNFVKFFRREAKQSPGEFRRTFR